MTTALSTRFLSVLRPAQAAPTQPHRDDCKCRTCTPRDRIEDQDFGAFLMRMIRAWEGRVIDNPELLLTNETMLARFAEITNVVMAINAERYAVDPRSGVSMLECARLLGITKSTASARRARGVAIMGDRIDRAGAARFAEARREREALEIAAQTAVDELAAWRARKAG
jgi:hypothetical protein